MKVRPRKFRLNKSKSSGKKGVDLERLKGRSKSSGKNVDPRPPPSFDIIMEKGKVIDVRLKFGSWSGYKVTELLDDPQGQRYIHTWLLSSDNDYPPKLIAAIEEILENNED